jgi:hypothetical protein
MNWNDAAAHGVENQVRGTMQVQLLRDTLAMRFHGERAEVQAAADLLIAVALSREL